MIKQASSFSSKFCIKAQPYDISSVMPQNKHILWVLQHKNNQSKGTNTATRQHTAAVLHQSELSQNSSFLSEYLEQNKYVSLND
jgi:hypothetical protein